MSLYLREKVGDKAKWAALGLSPAELKKRRDTRQRIEDYLIPYFGEHIGKRAIDKITDAMMRGYPEWREEQRKVMLARLEREAEQRRATAEERWKASSRLQKIYPDLAAYLPKGGTGHIQDSVSASAINTEIAILNDIFDFAVTRDLVSRKNLPEIKYQPVGDQEIRQGFSDEQLAAIRECARARFKEAQAAAVELHIRRRYNNGAAYSPDFLTMLRQRLRATGEGWVGDHVAYGRFVLMCAVDILAGTGMRPSTLAGIRRWQVRIHGSSSQEPDLRASLSPFDLAVSAELAERDKGRAQKRVPGIYDRAAPPPKYMVTGETRKGTNRKRKVVRKWSVVPERWSWPAFRMLLAHLPDEPQAKLIDVSPHAVNDAFKKVLVACGLARAPDGMSYSLYDLRHHYITKALLRGIPIALVATNTMTSVQMIERHYNHLKTEMAFDQLAG